MSTILPILQTDVPGYTPYRGKVRDVYDLGDRLAIVATDRISAFDWILPNGIPRKGTILTAMTNFWLDLLLPANHRLSGDVDQLPAPFRLQREIFDGRTMIVRKTRVVPVECVARGYLIGSGWKDYQQTGSVCGVALPPGLRLAEQLPEPIFTPATKAEHGQHDENIPFETMAEQVGHDLATELRRRTLELYQQAADYARQRGILLADTKFEFGETDDGELILIDECLTPDSSRYWPIEGYRVGQSPPSFDKQYVRDWLERTSWDKQSPPPQLPEEIVLRTAAKYEEAWLRLTSPVTA